MQDEEVIAKRICAHWNALVLDSDRSEIPLERDLAATIERIHALNIEVPSAARARVRKRLQPAMARPSEGDSLMPPSTIAVANPPLALPQWERPWPIASALPTRIRRNILPFTALAAMLLALATLSFPFVSSRLGRPSGDLMVIPAMTPPELAIPAAVEEFTGGDDPMVLASGVAVGADGTIYVIDTKRDQIRIFAADGEPKATWGKSGTGPGEFGFSFDFAFGDLAVAPDGNIYVLDTNNSRVQVFSPDGTFLFLFSESGYEEGQILYPQGIGVGPDGHVYVAEFGSHRVQVFDRDGTFLAAWNGSTGGGPTLGNPNDVAVTSDGTVWVTDDLLQQIVGFTPDGTFVRAIGMIGDDPGEMRGPWGIAVDAEDTLYVAEYDNDRVQSFSSDGASLGILGASGTEPGQFQHARFLAIGPDGALYVTDDGTNRVQRFSPDSLDTMTSPATPVPSS